MTKSALPRKRGGGSRPLDQGNVPHCLLDKMMSLSSNGEVASSFMTAFIQRGTIKLQDGRIMFQSSFAKKDNKYNVQFTV